MSVARQDNRDALAADPDNDELRAELLWMLIYNSAGDELADREDAEEAREVIEAAGQSFQRSWASIYGGVLLALDEPNAARTVLAAGGLSQSPAWVASVAFTDGPDAAVEAVDGFRLGEDGAQLLAEAAPFGMASSPEVVRALAAAAAERGVTGLLPFIELEECDEIPVGDPRRTVLDAGRAWMREGAEGLAPFLSSRVGDVAPIHSVFAQWHGPWGPEGVCNWVASTMASGVDMRPGIGALVGISMVDEQFIVLVSQNGEWRIRTVGSEIAEVAKEGLRVHRRGLAGLKAETVDDEIAIAAARRQLGDPQAGLDFTRRAADGFAGSTDRQWQVAWLLAIGTDADRAKALALAERAHSYDAELSASQLHTLATLQALQGQLLTAVLNAARCFDRDKSQKLELELVRGVVAHKLGLVEIARASYQQLIDADTGPGRDRTAALARQLLAELH